MADMLAQALEEGVRGLSSGLFYAPGHGTFAGILVCYMRERGLLTC